MSYEVKNYYELDFDNGVVNNAFVYDLKESLRASGFPARLDPNDFDLEKSLKRAKKLGSVPSGTAHDCFLKGIVVNFDLTLTHTAWLQLSRYHFIDIVSSMSKMYRLTKMDLNKQCTKNVDERIIKIVQEKINYFNSIEEPEEKKEYFNTLVDNVPLGLKLTARVTTNYLQLKTIKRQRKNHKLKEWHKIIEFIDSLPFFKEFTEINEEARRNH